METVFITGASSGIGLETARFLAEKNYRVFGTTRSLEKRRDLIAETRERYGDRLQFVQMDVTREDSVRQAAAQVGRLAGPIDVLICNAGTATFGSIEEMPLEMVRDQFAVNVFGVLATIQAVLPGMRERKSGRIIIMSSVAGCVAIPFQTQYSATKHAINAFTEGLRQEVRGFGVKVSAICAGDIHTPLQEATLTHIPGNSPYARWSRKCWSSISDKMAKAPGPLLVARTIYRILKKRNPAAFYTAADLLTSLAPILMPLMTSRMKEKAVRIFYGIDSP